MPNGNKSTGYPGTAPIVISTEGSTPGSADVHPPEAGSWHGVGRFSAVFLGVLLLFFVFELTPVGQRYLVIPVTSAVAKISATIIGTFDADTVSAGKTIWNPSNGFGVSIEAGCNGIEASIFLVAVMLAFPSSWRQKLMGIAIGTASVHLLNLLRIISLFYIGQWNQELFEWAHLYIWQALIMLDVLIVFLLWLRYLVSTRQPGSPRSSTA